MKWFSGFLCVMNIAIFGVSFAAEWTVDTCVAANPFGTESEPVPNVFVNAIHLRLDVDLKDLRKRKEFQREVRREIQKSTDDEVRIKRCLDVFKTEGVPADRLADIGIVIDRIAKERAGPAPGGAQ